MSEKKLETLVVEPPSRRAEACVLWFHGLGADYNDFVGIVPELNLDPLLNVRFIFPNAPMRPITLNGGLVMRAWYDICAMDLSVREDEAGIRSSEAFIHRLIEDQIKNNISPQKIILVGFSQGGALALHTGVRYPQRLGGVASLSGYLVLSDLLKKEKHEANQSLSIFMAHGIVDPVVPYVLGQRSLTFLKGAGFSPKWHTYPMGHQVCPQELVDLSSWIHNVLI